MYLTTDTCLLPSVVSMMFTVDVSEWPGIVQIFNYPLDCNWPLVYQEGSSSTYKLNDGDLQTCLILFQGDYEDDVLFTAKMLRPSRRFQNIIKVAGRGDISF